jgi:predicted cupin superfamily sugar epimerase
MSVDVTDVVRRHCLEPHPEGGWFRRTWEDPGRDADGRRRGSAILYLLGPGESSRWHRVDATELWLPAAGGPVELEHWADGAAAVTSTVLATRVGDGVEPQAVVAAGEWQRARAVDGWALVSCVVVPEFVEAGFELAPDGWQPPTPPT